MADVPLLVDLDPASISNIAAAVGKAFEAAGKAAGDKMSSAIEHSMHKASKKIASDLTTAVGDAMGKVNTTMTRAGAKAGKSWVDAWAKQFSGQQNAIVSAFKTVEHGVANALSREIADLSQGAILQMKNVMSRAETLLSPASLKRMPNLHPNQMKAVQMGMETSRSGMWAASEKAMVDTKAASRLMAEQIVADGRLRLQAEKNTGKLMAVQARAEADQMTAAKRIEGERRLAITKGIVKGVVALERGAIAAMTGLARTITSVMSRAASGAASAIKSMASGVGKLFHRSNSDMNDGLKSAFSKRNSMYRESFAEEEGIVRRAVTKQKEQLSKLNEKTSSGVLGAVTGRGMGMGLAGLVGGIGVGAWLKQGYTDAVSYNEQLNKTNVLFGKLNYGVVNFAKDSVKAFGATRAEALTAIGTFGNLFRAMDIGEKQSGMMSAGLVQLAGDLSSFNNVPIEDAFQAIQSGLVGETEPLRRFGVMLNEATIKAKALEMGLVQADKKGRIPNLTAQQKALASFNLIFDQTRAAQGDFARTSKEGANAVRVMSKSFQELGSTLMSALLPIMNKVVLAITGVVQGVTTFVTSASPMLELLKKALFGVAAALGAIIAVKGAVEVVKLVGAATKVALGPLGMLLTVVGLAGAAFAVMYSRSKPLRDAVAEIGKRFGEVGKKVGDFASSLNDGAGNFITDTVLPTLDKLATFLADHIVGAFDAVVKFVQTYVIPVFKTIVSFISDTVFPIFSSIGSSIATFFGSVINTIANFGTTVQPLIQPVIDGFMTLVDTIKLAFSGDFSKLGGGLRDFGSGIIGAIGNIVGKIGELLTPVAQSISKWFMGLFTPDKVKMYIRGVLNFIEMIGYAVGRVVTSPLFVKAVAGIAAAAVVIGFRLVKGIIRGIIDNLPGLWSMLMDALGAGFRAIMGNIGTIAMIALLAAFAIPRLVSGFKKIGATAAEGFANGFTGGIKAGGLASYDFFRGIAGKAGLEGQRAQKAFKKELDEINRQRAVLGAPKIGFGGQKLDTAKIAAARAELEKLQSQYSKAQIAGMAFRQNLVNTATNIGNAFKGVGKVISGLGTILKTGLRASKEIAASGSVTGITFSRAVRDGIFIGGDSIRKGFLQIWDSVKTQAKQSGQSVGAVAGKALGSAILAAAGGFMSGKAQGESGASMGSMLFGSAMTGLTAGLATGNPIIGVAAAGFSLLGSAIGAAGAEAKKFNEAAAKIRDSLKNQITQAAEDGKIAIDALKAGIIGMKDVADLGAVEQGFKDAFGTAGIETLRTFGVTWNANILPILQGGGSADEIKSKLLDTFSATATASEEWKKTFGGSADYIGGKLRELMKPGGGSGIGSLISALGGADSTMGKLVLANEDMIQGLIDVGYAMDKANAETFKALTDLNNESAVFGNTTKQVGKHVQDTYGPAFDTSKAQAEIEKVTNKTNLATEALAATLDAVKQLFNFGAGGELQDSIDNALISVDGLGTQMEEAFKRGGDVGAAQLRETFRSLSGTLADVVSTGLQTGEIITPADAKAKTKPVLDALLANVTDPNLRKQITDSFNKSLANLAPTIDTARTEMRAKEFNEQVQAYLEKHPGTMAVDAQVQVRWENLKTDLQGDAAGRRALNSGKITIPTTVATPPAAEVRQAYVSVGTNADAGFAKGIRDGRSGVIKAAVDTANAAAQAARNALQIESPSKVFKKIGQQISQGLALGITSETTDVRSAATSIVDEAVSAAVSAANRGKQIVQAALSELFKLSTGVNIANPQSAGLTIANANAAITTGYQSFLGTVTSNAQAIADATKKKPGERTAAEQNLVGENPYSLSPLDVTGAANLQAVQQQLQAIADLGQALLAAGSPVQSVIDRMTNEVKKFVDNAVKMGFSRKDLNQVVDMMGLSKEDLKNFGTAAGKITAPSATTTPAVTEPATLPAIPMVAPATSARASTAATTPTAPTSVTNTATNESKPTQYITVNLSLPYGDPEAVALAVSNRIATRV